MPSYEENYSNEKSESKSSGIGHTTNDNATDHTELYNSALIENLDTNDKVKHEISLFIQTRNELKNRKNLINYCGILDPASETDGCARVSSIYVPKFGKSHIKKTKIVNPYGALSQMYHKELSKVQKEKLIQFTSSYVKPIDSVLEFKSQNNK